MVFSSIPAYLDPSNWQQPGNSSVNHPQLHLSTQQTVPAPPPGQPHVGGGPGGSIRPGTMAERARLANMPMPEAALKCPRCESSNTKFCYFNNYSLTQPRHFCKTCRRYWTIGGALRSVPVGGGCRRNKRTKATTSKSPARSTDRQTTTSSSTSTLSSNSSPQANNISGLTPPIQPLRFLSPLSQLTDHYNGISAPMVGTNEMNFQLGPNNNTLLGCGFGAGVVGGGVGSLVEQWRLQQAQQFPFLGGLESSPAGTGGGLYSQFQEISVEPSSGFVGETSSHDQVRPQLSTSMLTQLASVKMEENHQELNLSRQILMGIPGNNDQWSSSAAAWSTDLTNFSSSSTRNPL
ncbi:hypothetical protein ACH5RR_005347 [Cinchona calisaya]|uniref:Dof zinc finger protein n=1 Tax=Cinchona calisaya TaxID=153742 RepID=A0ABD3AKX2_9GENT